MTTYQEILNSAKEEALDQIKNKDIDSESDLWDAAYNIAYAFTPIYPHEMFDVLKSNIWIQVAVGLEGERSMITVVQQSIHAELQQEIFEFLEKEIEKLEVEEE